MGASISGLAVECRGVSRDFDAGGNVARVLHGIDLDVPFGSLTMISGPSGSGKTTLISIIAGILSPTEGEVKVGQRSITTMPDRHKVEYRRRNIGFIFQQYNLLPALTAAENVAVPLVAGGERMPQAVRAATDVLDRMGLGRHAAKLPAELSGGEQQRVAIARALVHDPRIILCDEPTAALDAKNGANVMKMVREAAIKPDRAVIVVTHDSRIAGYADRVVHLEDGRIVDRGTLVPDSGAGT